MLPKPAKNFLLTTLFLMTSLAVMAQTNPIIDLVNDPNNDVTGNVTPCNNDGVDMPKIFLCGANDVATLTVSYPNAQSIDWQILDQNSCTNFGDDCTNGSPSCTYATVASGSTFPVNDAGKYRLRVTQSNGVSENHYFHVYQNDLEVLYQKADIGCEPTGNITVTNLGSDYGFQLVNTDSGQIMVPFSADNGPTFVITANGNYRVEVMQLNPNTGDPIENGCLFSTPAIYVGTSNFSVQASSTDADCNAVGTVSITAANGKPNYTYELRLDDGLDGGRGTLIDVVTNQSANTHTFTGVGQGDYVVVGRNSDGCEQSAQATVVNTVGQELTLLALVSQHITCKEGNIRMNVPFGSGDRDYAIWKYIDENGVEQISYDSSDQVINWQDERIFDILPGFEGNYTFITRSLQTGCMVTSNSIDIQFVPPAEFNTATVTDVGCFGDPSGEIQMNLVDSNGYQIRYYLFDRIITTEEANADGFSFTDAISSNASGYFPGLIAGEYSVVANMRKGNAECNFVETMIIESPESELAGEAILLLPYTCTQPGTIRAANVGGGTPFAYGIGTPGYDFSLNRSQWQPGVDTFTNLQPGIYTIFIRDSLGCIFETNEVEILPVESPEDLIFAPTQITCDDPTSDLTITIVGGTEPFDIQMTSPAIQAPNSIAGNVAVFENLAPGTYTFEVEDVNECPYQESFTILPITEIGVVGEPLQNVSCEGLSDGALRYTVDGFETTYSYTVVNSAGTTVDSGSGVTTNVIPLVNQPGETYTITVTDDVTTCTATDDVIINAPEFALDASLVVVDLSCTATGTNPGSVTITATGGWGGYEYELTDPLGNPRGPQSSNVFDNLTDTSGSYTVLVTDAGNCEFTTTFSLAPIDPLVLDVTANSLCYDDATGLILTATVTSGGDGNFRYRLNNGGYTTNNIFSGLAPGTYTVDVIDGRNCTASDQITVSPQMDVSATALPIASCETTTDVLVTASGGDGNLVYSVVPAGNTPSFGASNTVTVSATGVYDVWVRDNNGNVEYCEARTTVTIAQDPVLAMNVTVDPQVIPCAGESNGSITIAATGGATPYLYSIDGTNFQTNNTFVNLASGDYTVVVRDSNDCEVSEVHNIPETFTLSASAAVTQSPTCNPDDGTEVRILNAQGGTEPYAYSFDGGNTFSASNAAFLQPGTHLLILQDANGCPFEMPVTIDPAPEDPTFTHDTTYDCTGEGTVTVTPSSTDFNYTYTLDGSINTPADSNVFSNVSPGYHTVTVDYLPTTPLAPSVLLSETFGAGANTAFSEVDPIYCYEPQNGTNNGCPHPNTVPDRINDGEYSITRSIERPFGAWVNPVDHTGGDPDGRYLAINIGDVAGSLGIIYAKRNIDVVANRDINISLFAMNLLSSTSDPAKIDPDILIELVDSSGNTIASTTTGDIPKSNGPNNWRNYSVNLNPGVNSTLDIVIRTFKTDTNGNDLAVDDITATQAAEDCPQQETFQVYVDEGQALAASITAQTNPLCVTENNGSITFEVENFDAAAGFVYSTDSGGSFSAPQTTSPVTLSNLPAGTYDIIIQDATNATCSTTISATLTDPEPLSVTADATQEMSCSNMVAIITADASGGTPGYLYQLEDATSIVTPFQPGFTFEVIAAGDYNIRVRDANLCEALTDAAISIVEPETVVFDVDATTCYSGNNDAAIQIDVTAGNGNYQFQIDNGPWLTPSPSTATTHIFGSLPAGSYTVNVKDGLGCIGTAVPVTINPELTASARLDNDLTCLADASITVTANGGSGTYIYEWSNTNSGPWNTSGFTGNVFTTAADGTYYFRVTDNTAPTPCFDVVGPITITPTVNPQATHAVTNVSCSGNPDGSVLISIDKTLGIAPYTVSFNGSPFTTQTAYSGLVAGSYDYIVRDGKGCEFTDTATVTEPTAATANINSTPLVCTPLGISLGSVTVTNVTGGTPGYTYYLYNQAGVLATTTTANPLGSTLATDIVFDGVPFGNYYVRVIDANGCEFELGSVQVTSPPSDLDIVATPTGNCITGLVYDISIVGGVGPFEIKLYDGTAFTVGDGEIPNGLPTTSGTTYERNHRFNSSVLFYGINYVFEVLDTDTGCTYIEEVSAIDSPSTIDVTGTATDIACTLDNNGAYAFTVTGYSGTELSWEVFENLSGTSTGITGSINSLTGADYSNSVSGLGPGEYNLLVLEADASSSQCSDAVQFRIVEPTPVQIEWVSQTTANCNELAQVTVRAFGGNGPYTFAFVEDGDSPVLGDYSTDATALLDPAINTQWDAYAMDANGCVAGPRDITIAQDTEPTITLTHTDQCVAGEGEFSVNVTLDTEGVSPYYISVNNSGPQLVSALSVAGDVYTISNLSSGINTVRILDANGCGVTESIEFHPPLQMNAQLTALIDCEPAPANNGEITISVSAGSGNYAYEITGEGSQSRIALPSNPFIWNQASTPGIYTVTVYDMATTDALGNPCSFSKDIEIAAPVHPSFDPVPVDVTCFGGNDGAIIVNELDLGIGPVDYALTPAVDPYNPTTGRFENLPAGTYSITATAANSCSTTIDNIVVGQPDEIQVPLPMVTEFGCTAGNNPNNAIITVDPTGIIGGSGTYLVYEFINDATGAIVQRGSLTTYTETDLAGGTYTINVYDDNGCEGTTNVPILPYDELQDATITVGPVTCVPGNDGTLTVAVTSSQGSPLTDFEFSLNNGGAYQDPNVFSGLSAGNYLVTVRHKETQCIITANATIEEPNTFAVEFDVVQDVVCFGTDSGEVTLQFTDATYTGDFNYTVYDTNGTPVDLADDVAVHNGSETVNTVTPVITLGAGSYRVEAIQVAAPQCTQETIFSIGTPQEGISAEARKMDITCVPGNDGIIEIFNADGGWGGYTYYVGITPPADATSYVSGPRFENLGVGIYQAWVRDVRGCEYQIPGTLELAIPVAIEAHLQVNSENCEGANGELEVIIDVAGGQGENYSYQLIKDLVDFGPPQTDPIFSGLAAGSYQVRIYDQWGCEVIVTEELLEPMVASYDVVQTIDCDAPGEVTVTVTGGSGNFEYQVTKPDGVVVTNTDGIFTNLDHTGDAPADYVFIVTDLDTDPQCTTPITVTLDKPTPVTLEPFEPTHLSCINADDGAFTISLEPTAEGVNDDPIYTYTIVNTTTGTAAVTQDSPVFTNLEPGVYDITVISGRGCPANIQKEVLEPAQLAADPPQVDPFTCNANNTVNVATITVDNIRGGTSDYFYSVDGTNYFPVNGTSINHAVTVAGDYTIYLRDANSCPITLGPVTVEPLPVISLSLVEGAADCPTGQEITVTSTGHSTPTDLTFELLETGEVQANLATDMAIFNLMEPGIYNIKVTDNVTGCYKFFEHEIDQRPQWDVALTAATPITCFGNTNGTLEIAITGYTGAYTYELMEGMADENQPPVLAANQGMQTSVYPLVISDLSPGNYFVRVTPTDYPYCEPQETLVGTIESPGQELLAEVEARLASGCANDMGEISVVPTGGYAPYNITLTPSTGTPIVVTDVPAGVFTGLAHGTYDVAVVDAQGCPWTGTANVIETLPIVASATNTDYLCYGTPEGTVTGSAVGGSGPDYYAYFLNVYEDDRTTLITTLTALPDVTTFTDLNEGWYSIVVTDNLGCSDESDLVYVDGPDPYSVTARMTTAPNCLVGAEITATAVGGTAPYQYQLEDEAGIIIAVYQDGNVFTDVAPDTRYRVRVLDGNGCETLTQTSVIVPQIPPVQLSIDFASASVSCADAMTASIYASAIGGIGEYTFELILGGTVVNTLTDFRKAEFEDLAPGDYTVRVTSEGGCEPDEEPVSIANPEVLNFEAVPTPISCTGEEDGVITIIMSGGGRGYQFAISPNLDQFFDEDPSQGLPEGQYRFEDLAPGTYTVIGQDANGCFYVEDIEIINPTPVAVSIDSIQPEGCVGDADGSATIVISGGTPPYSTAFNSNSANDFVEGEDTVTFDGLSNGTYFVFIKDANGCDTNITLDIGGGENLNATVVPVYDCDSNRVMNYLNVTFEDDSIMEEEDVLYALDSYDVGDSQLYNGTEPRNMAPGQHFITFFKGMCSRSYDFTIEDYLPVSLALENNNINEITAIATDGLPPYTFYFNDVDNGQDNTYMINRSGIYTVRVVDQLGCEAIQTIDMEFVDIELPDFFTPDGDGMNDSWLPRNIEGWPEIIIKIYDRYGRVVAELSVNSPGWDGLYNDKELPTGDYWYVVQLNGENDNREFMGHFTLYR